MSCRHLAWGGDGLSHAPSASLALTSHYPVLAKAGPLLLWHLLCLCQTKNQPYLLCPLQGNHIRFLILLPGIMELYLYWPGWLQFWGGRLYSVVVTPCLCVAHESQVGVTIFIFHRQVSQEGTPEITPLSSGAGPALSVPRLINIASPVFNLCHLPCSRSWD